MYIWERPGWPEFQWDGEALRQGLALAYERRGELRGLLSGAPAQLQDEAELRALSAETVDNSKIEGEAIDMNAARSSLARRLGIPQHSRTVQDAKTEGVVEVTLDVLQHYDESLTAERIFRWHEHLFPADYEKRQADSPIGRWRTEAEGTMQVISGPYGKRRIHFEAPPAERVPEEMREFLAWFPAPTQEDGIIFAGLAHLRYLTIHPFFDGNGRTGRAIADLALARTERVTRQYYSLSQQILLERRVYYDALEHAQSGTLDITEWLLWFINCYTRAIETGITAAHDVLQAAHFWMQHADKTLTERQREIIKLLLGGFEGNFTVKRWSKIAKISEDAAYRDISDLIDKGLLTKQGGSKNTYYTLLETSSPL